jgi:hypothetical protein
MRRNGNPYQNKFTAQRARAKNRSIAWDLTFDQWLSIWNASGKLHLRGRGAGKFVMSRRGDVGPYSVENVEIAPYEVNAREVNFNHPDKCGGMKRLGLGRGSYRVQRGNRVTYLSRFRGKYLGVFDTPELAEAAYQIAVSNYLKTEEKL